MKVTRVTNSCLFVAKTQNINLFILKILIFALLLAFQEQSKAEQPLLLLTDNAPPHMIEENESGIDVDIVSRVFELMDYSVKVEFAPLKRNMEQVRNHKGNVFFPTFYQHDGEGLYYSKSFIEYRPSVFTLKEKNYSFKKLSDLKNKNILSFQGASGYFGDVFLNISRLGRYREVHDMSKIPVMLLLERSQVVVLDFYIFNYFLNSMMLIIMQLTRH